MKKIIFIILFFLPTVTHAATTDVRITEIMYDASGSDTGHEWVELWNGGSESVNITGGSGSGSWRFNDGANHTFATSAYRGSLILAPGDFLIISSNTDTFLIDHPNFSGNLVKVSFSLGNTSETLLLRIETNGAPWSEVSYTNSLAAGNGKTLEWNRDTNAWSESANAGGTPGSFPASNSTPPPSPEPPPPSPPESPPSEPPPAPEPNQPTAGSENQEVGIPAPEQARYGAGKNQEPTTENNQPSYDLTVDLRITEFLPDPTGSDMEEWIEIWNPMNRVADLSGWKIDDGEGGSNPYEFPVGAQIRPGAYEVFSRRLTGLQLNNELDSVRLFRPDGIIKDQVAYGDAPEGSSYAKDGIVWKWTASPTPGAENVFPQPTAGSKNQEVGIPAPEQARYGAGKNQETVTDNQEVRIKNQEAATEKTETPHQSKLGTGQARIKNQAFTFEGTITVPPGVFATQYFYAQNESRGLQIYMYKKDFPPLEIGTKIRASGIMGVAYGEDRLKLNTKEDIAVLGEEEIAPEEAAFEDLNDSKIGKLVLISGDVIDKSKSGFMMAQDDSEFEVVWKKGAGDTPDIFPGDAIKVAGIVQKNKDGFRILPRNTDDVEIIKKADLASADRAAKKSSGLTPLAYIAVPLLAFGAAFGFKKLGKKRFSEESGGD